MAHEAEGYSEILTYLLGKYNCLQLTVEQVSDETHICKRQVTEKLGYWEGSGTGKRMKTASLARIMCNRMK